MNELDRIVEAARGSVDSDVPSALATILATAGSSFRRAGTRLWIGDGRRVGAISGGCLESDLAERSRAVLASGRPIVVPYDSAADGDVLWGSASGCGGLLQILLEPVTLALVADLEWVLGELGSRRAARLVTLWDGVRAHRVRGDARSLPDPSPLVLDERHLPPVALTIFGPGDDARTTARLAHDLGWKVLHLPSTPAGDAALGSGEVLADDRAAVLLMTHNFHRDADLLARIGALPFAYIGVLGPRRRTLELLAREGMPPESLAALHAPPGLDIGGETPEEIALSVVAEIQAHFAGRAGGKLRERSAPIHDRAPAPELAGSERKP